MDLDQADREAQDALTKWHKSPHDGYKGKRGRKAILKVAERLKAETQAERVAKVDAS